MCDGRVLSIQARIQVSSRRLPTFLDLQLPFTGGDNSIYDLHIFQQGRKNISKTLKKIQKTPKKLCKNHCDL